MGFQQPGLNGPGPTMVEAELGHAALLRAAAAHPARALQAAVHRRRRVQPVERSRGLRGHGDRGRGRHAGAGSARPPVRPGGHAPARAPRGGRFAGRPLRARRRGRRRHAGLTGRRCGRSWRRRTTTRSRAVCATTSRHRAATASLVHVAWSSVNYKDALATIARGQVARISPLIPGIDLAGTLEDGSEVLAHGYEARRLPPRRLRRVRAGAGRLARAAPGRPDRSPGDGDRHRRLHRRALRDRVGGGRPDARAPARSWSPARAAGSARPRSTSSPRRGLRGRRLLRQGPGVAARRWARPR